MIFITDSQNKDIELITDLLIEGDTDKLKLNDIVKISYNHFNLKSRATRKTYIVQVIEMAKDDNSWLHQGTIINPFFEGSKVISFFNFQIIHNFGNIDLDTFEKKYPEYLI